jgi:protein-tyrosine phosphatase
MQHQRKSTHGNGLDVNHPAVLFVCLGNICRSPLARALFQAHSQSLPEAMFHCDSAGTSSTHEGETADPRTLRNARENGLIFEHRARQVRTEDFFNFQYMLAMDRDNLRYLQVRKPNNSKCRLHLIREWDSTDPGADVPDPWYGDEHGFERVFHMLERCTRQFHAYLQERYTQSNQNG